MTIKQKFGAALLVVALAILPAAVFHLSTHTSIVALLFGLGAIAAGTTITYQTFQDGSGPHGGYTGGTTAPTTAQSATVNAVVAQVSFGDTDTIATITHSLGITTAQLAALQPYVQMYLQTAAATTNTYPLLTVALTNSSTVTINKVSNTGTGGTWVVIIRRPGTPGY